MKYYSILILLILSTPVYSQVKFYAKIINEETNKPLEGVYCYILKDNDKCIQIGLTDKNGILSTRLWNVERNATYQIDISEGVFKPLRQTINLFDKKRDVIKLSPDSISFFKRENLVYMNFPYNGCEDFNPGIASSLYELPDRVRNKLVDHLLNRLGLDYYSRLRLIDVSVFDLNIDMFIHRTTTKPIPPFCYIICFSFSDTTKGLGLYTARILVDNSGEIMKEIHLPDIKKEPQKANILSLEQVKKIATENKFYDDHTTVSLSYDNMKESIIWDFQNRVYTSDSTFTDFNLILDAHSGVVLDRTENNTGRIEKIE